MYNDMEKGQKKMNFRKIDYIWIFVVLIVFGASVLLGGKIQKDKSKEELMAQGYYPLQAVMKVSGYTALESDKYTYSKEEATVTIGISYDFKKEICEKNRYEFSLEHMWLQKEDDIYVYKEVLEKILNCELTYTDNGKISANPISFTQHEWTTAFEPLVAHSGGYARLEEYAASYCNALEVLLENYSLGHRVFEIDFYLTSDNKLAAVHDWNHQGNFDGEWLSEEEWRNSVVYGQPGGEFTSMMIDDILDEMLVNKDMFIVTDTKFEGIETLLQFQLIYDAAKERDLTLLDRIIPQIYNEYMYELIMSVYEFPSIIYTVYATDASADEVIYFAEKHQNIRVITAPKDDARFDENAIGKIHDNDLLLYTHTIQSYAELTLGKAKGVDGFYTGLLLPRDIETYNNIKEW